MTGHRRPRAAGSTAEDCGAKRHGRQQAGAYLTADTHVRYESTRYTTVAGKRAPSAPDRLTMICGFQWGYAEGKSIDQSKNNLREI